MSLLSSVTASVLGLATSEAVTDGSVAGALYFSAAGGSGCDLAGMGLTTCLRNAARLSARVKLSVNL
jgi:hypothetical protein